MCKLIILYNIELPTVYLAYNAVHCPYNSSSHNAMEKLLKLLLNPMSHDIIILDALQMLLSLQTICWVNRLSFIHRQVSVTTVGGTAMISLRFWAFSDEWQVPFNYSNCMRNKFLGGVLLSVDDKAPVLQCLRHHHWPSWCTWPIGRWV